MPYRAPAGGGLFGSSVYPDSRPRIDVGGAIDAIGGTALSLTQQAYNRRLGQQQLALEQQRQADARQQMANEERYRGDQLALERSNAQFEQGIKTRQQDAADTSALADYYSRGFVDEPTSLTEGAYSAPAPAQASTAVVTPPGPSVPSAGPIAGPRVVRRGDGMVGAAPAAAPASSASAASSAPSITVGGHRLVLRGYGASTQGQAESQRLNDALTEEAARAKDAQSLAEVQGKINMANEMGRLTQEHTNKLSEIVADAKAKFDYGMPKPDEMRTVGHVPELVGSLQDLDKYKPNLTAALAKGTLGNYLKSPEGQQYEQAVNDFVSTLAFARGTRAPRAAELTALAKSYSPQPGDSPQVLEQKTRQRLQAVRDIVGSAPRAARALDQPTLTYLGIDPDALMPTPSGNTGGNAASGASATPASGGRRVGPGKGSATGATDYVSKYGITP